MRRRVIGDTEPAGGWLHKRVSQFICMFHFIPVVAPFTDLPIPTPNAWKLHSGTEAWHSRGTAGSDQTLGANASEGVGRRSDYVAADGLRFPLFWLRTRVKREWEGGQPIKISWSEFSATSEPL